MCRFVILVAISAALVSCVLGQTEAQGTSPPEPPTPLDLLKKCVNESVDINEAKKSMKLCLYTTLERHLNDSAILAPGDCQNATDLTNMIDVYFDAYKKDCNLTFDSTYIKKLVEFSLRNDSFKTFYEDVACLKQFEVNISNTCVKDKVGFFNISIPKKHTTWTHKTRLQFSKNTCGISKLVENCVAAKLHSCKKPEYVISLFQYAREIGNCSQFTDNLPDPTGTAAPLTMPSWLTLPVMITLGIGAAVVVAAIITIIVLKCKN